MSQAFSANKTMRAALRLQKSASLLVGPLLLSLIAGSIEPISGQQPFRFDGLPTGGPSDSTNGERLIWQPLGRASSFRPPNIRRPETAVPRSPAPPPTPAAASSEPPLALALSNRSRGFRDVTSSGESSLPATPASSTIGDSEPVELARPVVASTGEPAAPPPPTSSPTSSSNETNDNEEDDDDDGPTRQPLSRFRPTKAPSSEPAASLAPALANVTTSQPSSSISDQPTPLVNNECFECICEASTGCNANSRCQTSDVRHTRCGMFLISYDQWRESGLSRELVTAEALARDVAADERAFYECVTSRPCAERLISTYMRKNARDCDKDGRIDCYDFAALLQGGPTGCASEALLDSQYWADFNACFGFA